MQTSSSRSQLPETRPRSAKAYVPCLKSILAVGIIVRVRAGAGAKRALSLFAVMVASPYGASTILAHCLFQPGPCMPLQQEQPIIIFVDIDTSGEIQDMDRYDVEHQKFISNCDQHDKHNHCPVFFGHLKAIQMRVFPKVCPIVFGKA